VLVPASEVKGPTRPRSFTGMTCSRSLRASRASPLRSSPSGTASTVHSPCASSSCYKFCKQAPCSIPCKLLGSPVVPSVIRLSTDLGDSLAGPLGKIGFRFPNLWLCLGCREERNPHSQILGTPVLELMGQCPWSHSPCILLLLLVCVYQNVADL
jgi:hypothetical protein